MNKEMAWCSIQVRQFELSVFLLELLEYELPDVILVGEECNLEQNVQLFLG